MVSTLKLTKIQIPNSDSDVISLDASSGNITIPKNITASGTLGGNSITVQGEGSATTNLQQGLLKCWSTVEMDNSNNIPDSFNSSGITDNGTGTPQFLFTNSMATAASYVFAGAGEDGVSVAEQGANNDARTASLFTGSVKTRSRRHDGGIVDGHHMIMVAGDLA